MADSSNEPGSRNPHQYSVSSFLPPAGTNRCPSDSEQHTIRTAIENAFVIRDQYRDEAAHLRAKLGEAEAHLAQIDSYLSAHRGAISAFRRLPIEVLTEIFQSTLDVEIHPGGPLGYGITSLNQGPWKLSRVCHHWRGIVVNCPALWSSFHINVMPSHPTNIFVALNRTGEHLLTFNLDMDERGRRVVQWLLQESHRWENASIWLQPFFQEELLGVQRKLEALRSLRILSSSSDVLRSCQNIFSVASQLKEVTLIHKGHVLDVLLNLPSHVSTISVKTSSVSQSFMEALSSRAKSLERLELFCRFFKNSQYRGFRTRSFSALRSLTVNDATVLHSLPLPHLERLVCIFKDPCNSSVCYSQCISARLGKGDLDLSFLHALHMFDESSTPANMLVILRAAPQLQDLGIRVREMARGTYLTYLLWSLTEKPLLIPHLRHFSFTEGAAGKMTSQPWTELMDMVETRRAEGVVLQTLNFKLARPAPLPNLNHWDLERLRSFQEDVSLMLPIY